MFLYLLLPACKHGWREIHVIKVCEPVFMQIRSFAVCQFSSKGSKNFKDCTECERVISTTDKQRPLQSRSSAR